jgi:hypothetical protein
LTPREEGCNFAISGGHNFEMKPGNHGFTLFVAIGDFKTTVQGATLFHVND